MERQIKYLGIAQARLSSSRLPGKVLRPICGKPMLELQLERIARSHRLDRIIVATGDDEQDDPLEALCRTLKVDCFRGSLNDVLERFFMAARHYRPENVVRFTGDCPLIDPGVVDDTIALFDQGDFDYVSNVHPPTFPDGLDCEVMRFSCLESAWRNAGLRSEREHVTPYIYSHPEQFRIGNHFGTGDFSELRWTVDEPADFEVVSRIFESLYPENPAFSWREVLALLQRHPEIDRLNCRFLRNEGYRKSQQEDQIVYERRKS